MTKNPDSPQVLKAGLVLMDATTSVVTRVVVLQYAPDSLSRTLTAQTTADSGGGGNAVDRSEVLRLKGPPVETFKLDAEIDATDQLEANDPTAVQSGLFPQLAALETII